MNRKQFLKSLGVGAVAVAVAPYLPEIAPVETALSGVLRSRALAPAGVGGYLVPQEFYEQLINMRGSISTTVNVEV